MPVGGARQGLAADAWSAASVLQPVPAQQTKPGKSRGKQRQTAGLRHGHKTKHVVVALECH